MRSLASPRVAFGATLALGAVLVALVTIAAGGGASKGPARNRLQGPLMPPHLRAAAFALPDQDGRIARISQYRGRVVILTFLHSRCHGACPIIAQQIRGALNELGPQARDVRALAISVDPRQDTVRNVRHFLSVEHVGGVLRYLRGTRRELAPVWRAYAVQPVGGRYDHTAFAFLIDRDGVERVGYPLTDITPEAIAHDARVLLRE